MRSRKKVKKQKVFKIAFPISCSLLPQMTVKNEQFQDFIRHINTKLMKFFSELSNTGHLWQKEAF